MDADPPARPHHRHLRHRPGAVLHRHDRGRHRLRQCGPAQLRRRPVGGLRLQPGLLGDRLAGGLDRLQDFHRRLRPALHRHRHGPQAHRRRHPAQRPGHEPGRLRPALPRHRAAQGRLRRPGAGRPAAPGQRPGRPGPGHPHRHRPHRHPAGLRRHPDPGPDSGGRRHAAPHRRCGPGHRRQRGHHPHRHRRRHRRHRKRQTPGRRPRLLQRRHRGGGRRPAGAPAVAVKSHRPGAGRRRRPGDPAGDFPHPLQRPRRGADGPALPLAGALPAVPLRLHRRQRRPSPLPGPQRRHRAPAGAAGPCAGNWPGSPTWPWNWGTWPAATCSSRRRPTRCNSPAAWK